MNETADGVEEVENAAEEEDLGPGPQDANDTSARSEHERVQKAGAEHVPKIPKYSVGGGCSGGGLH